MTTTINKMVLVPEPQFRRLQQRAQNVSSNTILDDVKRPNEREMVKTYANMEHQLHDPSKTDQEKVAEHVEAMNDFSVLRDRVTGRRELMPVMSKPKSVAPDVVVEDAIDMMPLTLQKQARQLLQRLAERKDIISWAPSGEVTIAGQRMIGSNISDLVSDVLRQRKGVAPNRDYFLKTLAAMNVPEQFVRNQTALAHYRLIKKGGSRRPRSTIRRPPGIPSTSSPLQYVATSPSESDNDYNDNSLPGRTPATKRRRSASLSAVKRGVQFVNL